MRKKVWSNVGWGRYILSSAASSFTPLQSKIPRLNNFFFFLISQKKILKSAEGPFFDKSDWITNYHLTVTMWIFLSTNQLKTNGCISCRKNGHLGNSLIAVTEISRSILKKTEHWKKQWQNAMYWSLKYKDARFALTSSCFVHGDMHFQFSI